MMFVMLLPVKSFAGVCPIEDLECLSPILLPQYSNDPDSVYFPKEWTSYNGEAFAFEDRIVVRTRFDQEAFDILNSGDFGLEVDVVLKGLHRNIGLKETRSTFPSNAKVGRDTPVFDQFTNGLDNRSVGLHVLNPSALSAEVDYYSIFIFDDDLPSDGVKVSTVNLQITVDIDYGPFLHNLIVEQIPQLDQFQYYVFETDRHFAFTAYPDGTLIPLQSQNSKTPFHNIEIILSCTIVFDACHFF